MGFLQHFSLEVLKKELLPALLRRGLNHDIAPHKINHSANIYALQKLGVKRIIATNAIGAITETFKPKNLLIPHDFIDFTKFRPITFYKGTPVIHVDLSQPYCPEVRKVFIETAKKKQNRGF